MFTDRSTVDRAWTELVRTRRRTARIATHPPRPDQSPIASNHRRRRQSATDWLSDQPAAALASVPTTSISVSRLFSCDCFDGSLFCPWQLRNASSCVLQCFDAVGWTPRRYPVRKHLVPTNSVQFFLSGWKWSIHYLLLDSFLYRHNAQCAGSENEHAIASDIRKNQSCNAHVFVTPSRAMTGLHVQSPVSISALPFVSLWFSCVTNQLILSTLLFIAPPTSRDYTVCTELSCQGGPEGLHTPSSGWSIQVTLVPCSVQNIFKVACLAYTIISTGQPIYFRALFHHYTPHRTLRSVNQHLLV